MKDICVIGVGYVGLVTAAGFSDLGNRVTALDINEERVNNLRKGILPIYEPGLEEVVHRNVPAARGAWGAAFPPPPPAKPLAFSVVSCPEFLREGCALSDFHNPARTVLGSMDREAADKVAPLHLPLRAPIVITDLRTAEVIKSASNAFLATKISFINEIANICEALGA